MDKYREIIQAIYTEIIAAGNMHASLFGGYAGFLPFLHQYGLAFEHDTSGDMGAVIEGIMDTYSPNASFCGGSSGICWSYHYLFRNGSLEKEDLDLLCHNDESFKESMWECFAKGNYDFLHGALGIAWYFLYKGNEDERFFSRVLEELDRLAGAGEESMIPFYAFDKRMNTGTVVNLGLAHGIPSVLKYCVQCFQQGICREKAEKLAYRIISYLKRHANENDALSIFPSGIGEDPGKGKHSRLAWCYGDLSIAFILYQAARAFREDSLEAYALDIVRHTLSRRTSGQTSVLDAGICHGSAGVAHLYHRMWQLTGSEELREATDYWMQKTLDLAVHEKGIAGFKKYNAMTGNWEEEYGLLEGVAGIGLVLLSYLTGDLSWDYCLMLNDID